MKMWGNVLTIFTHKKMIKHVHEKVKSLFDFLSLSLIVFRLMSMISFMLQERVKMIQGLFILCLTQHHHLTHAMRNKNKEKAKTLRKDDDNVDKKFFFLIFTILYLCFNATNAAVIKKSHVS